MVFSLTLDKDGNGEYIQSSSAGYEKKCEPMHVIGDSQAQIRLCLVDAINGKVVRKADVVASNVDVRMVTNRITKVTGERYRDIAKVSFLFLINVAWKLRAQC